jgi:hypothetical protein
VAAGSLGAVIGGFKSASTRTINLLRGTPGAPVWQSNYHDQVIHTEGQLRRIVRYVMLNPRRS